MVLLGACTTRTGVDDIMGASVLIMKDTAVGQYHPDKVSVEAGGTVTWTNKSGVVHNVVFKAPSVKSSGLIKDGETFSAEFANRGAYPYLCTLHPTMRGEVEVK
jgi:plastocyanin